MTTQHFPRPAGLAPVSNYSHAVAATGRLVAVAGQLPVDADGTLIAAADPLAQARQVFANITIALAAADARPRDVLKLTFYLIDIGDLASVRQARDEFVGAGPAPASTLVQVTALAIPGARLEIDAFATTNPSDGPSAVT